MGVTDAVTIPDTSAIRRDLEYMTARWHELPMSVVFEVRCFAEGKKPQTFKFAPDWIDEAVDTIENMNGLGFNIYVVRNPIRADVAGSATDADIVGSFFLWADCDDEGSASNVRRFDGPKYHAAVITGKTPETRVHTYWELEEFVTDMTLWRDMQIAIAGHFNSDRAVINPSRIMRVGGTVAYPDSKKQARGYVKEVVSFRNDNAASRPRVTIEQMRRVFGTQAPQQSLTIDTGPQPLDRERVRIQALSGKEWHNAVIRLVGSYVSKGLSDEEIHGLTDPLTLAGYAVEQTRREVQTAIDGARRKGWTPEDYPQVSFPDTAAQIDAHRGLLEWFDDVEPSLTDSYLVKGVLSAEAMSVIYGPSNSGKTFFAMDIAYHVAIGAHWRQHRVRQACVLYLAAEGGRGVANRIAALKNIHGVCDVPFALRRAGLDLLRSEANLRQIYDLIQEMKARHPDMPVLLVIDTLSRVMAGGDENSAADMTALIRNIDAIREATGAHIMLVHHTGKDTARGARGHSSLRAATDTEIEVQNEDGARAAMVTKQRDYQGGETFAFSLKTVILGIDQDGDEVSSCIVEAADSEEFAAARKQKKGLGGNQKIIADTFDQMLADGFAKPNPGGVGFPGHGTVWTVPMEELKRISMGKMAATNKRSAFSEAWKALTDARGLFCAASDLVWRLDRKVN